ncbi:1360_t:CDS:2 [Entrophospora sp. SA101]|nr:1360_t:CDS:2 [Entrophospora sp. SA101]
MEKKSFKEYLAEIEDPKNNREVNHSLPENPTPLQVAKYKLCKKILGYKLDHELTREQMVEKIGISKAEIEDILFCCIEEFTLDRLVSYASKIFEPLELGITRAKEKEPIHLNEKHPELSREFIAKLFLKLGQEERIEPTNYKGKRKVYNYKARENYTQTISHIVFDEAIINPKTGEDYLEDEQEKIKELLGSAWRDRDNDPKPKLIYIANPYERFRPFLEDFLPVIRKQRSKLLGQVLGNELVRLEAGKKELYLFKNTTCQKVCECELENCLELWQGFFAKEEDLRMCEFVNGSRALFVFSGCVFYQAKAGYWFFVHRDSKDISNKEDLPLVKEYCLTYEQRLKSQQKVKWDYSEELLREELLGKWERGRLFFVDSQSKEVIMEFLGKGKVKQSSRIFE